MGASHSFPLARAYNRYHITLTKVRSPYKDTLSDDGNQHAVQAVNDVTVSRGALRSVARVLHSVEVCDTGFSFTRVDNEMSCWLREGLWCVPHFLVYRPCLSGEFTI